MKFFSIGLVIFSFFFIVLLRAENNDSLSDSRLKLIESRFEDGLGKLGATSGAMCIVSEDKIIFTKEFKKAGIIWPLGESSCALISLMALAMEDDGKIYLNKPVSKYFSQFRLGGADSKVTLENLLSMNAGISAHSDTLVPEDSEALDTLDIIAQIPPTSVPSETFSRSRLSVSAGGYAIGYVFNRSEKNFKKSFAAASKKYLFEPLGFSEPRFSSFDKPTFPATAYALSILDVEKWLQCEISKNPKISKSSTVAARRIPGDVKNKFSQGWLLSTESGTQMLITGDYHEGCANLVAIIPSQNIAVALFVRAKKDAPKLCAQTLSSILEMQSNSTGKTDK